MAAIACYKLHNHYQQKPFWILGTYLVCIFSGKREGFFTNSR